MISQEKAEYGEEMRQKQIEATKDLIQGKVLASGIADTPHLYPLEVRELGIYTPGLQSWLRSDTLLICPYNILGTWAFWSNSKSSL